MNKLLITEDLISQVTLPEGISVRQFVEIDFPSVQKIYEKEGWLTFIKRENEALEAWKNSSIGLIAFDGEVVIGFVRALTDGEITTYIAEIIIESSYRGKGIGKALLHICHCLYPHTRFDLLSTDGSDEFYESNKFRKTTGFRKSTY